jgi:hypothetical protein
MSCVSILTLLCKRSLACGELSFPGSPAPPGASYEGPSLLGAASPLGPFIRPIGNPRVKNHRLVRLVTAWPVDGCDRSG